MRVRVPVDEHTMIVVTYKVVKCKCNRTTDFYRCICQLPASKLRPSSSRISYDVEMLISYVEFLHLQQVNVTFGYCVFSST